MKKFFIMVLLAALCMAVMGSASAQFSTGDRILFGHYEQDGDLSNGPEPIEWLVLTAENGRALLLSSFGLDVQPFHSELAEINWAESSLRHWLNGPFFEMAFTAEEATQITEVLNSTPDHPVFGTDGGEDTFDRVFLLSAEEVKQYMPSTEERICDATDYAEQNGAYIDSYNGYPFWWLRSPGYNAASAAIVFSTGLIYTYGSNVTNSTRLARPALWLEL